MAWSCVIDRRNVAWTDYRGVKVFFSHVPSGWLLAGTFSVERKKRANCSSVCLMCETTWDFFPRSTIHAKNGSWEIFRRHFRTLRYLVPRESLMTNGKLRYRNKFKIKPAPRLKKQVAESNLQSLQSRGN